MATGKVIGKIEVASIGSVKIVGADGAMRDATYEGLMYEGEQIVSNDPETLFQIRYLALPEATVYEGVFGVLADGSVIANVSELETLFGDDIDFMETAAGDGEADPNSGIPEDAGIFADSNVQAFNRGENSEVGLGTKTDGNGNSEVGRGAKTNGFGEASIYSLNNNAPTAENGAVSAMEDVLDAVSGQLDGSDADGNAIEFVMVSGLAEDGSEGNLILNPDGTYSYQLDEGDFDYLSRGETATVTFTYKTVETDGPYESEVATVAITVTGTNDRPVVTDIDNGTYESYDSTDVLGVDDTEEDVYTTFVGTIDTVSDVDLSDEHTYEVVANVENKVEVSDANVVVSSISISLNEDTGLWEYTVVADANSLAVGETATVAFDYRAIDDSGSGAHGLPNEPSVSIPATITLTIMGTNDQPIVSDVTIEEAVFEADGMHTYTFDEQLSVTDADTIDTHTFHLVGGAPGAEEEDPHSAAVVVTIDNVVSTDFNARVHLDLDGNFNIVGDFDALSEGEEAVVTFSYYAVDNNEMLADEFNESSYSEAEAVTLTIVGTNDAPVILPDQSFTVNESLSDIGLVVASDVDSTELTYSIVNPDGTAIDSNDAIFEIDGDGNITLKDGALDYETDTEYTLFVKVTDDYDAFDIESVTVTVNDVTGTVETISRVLVSHTFDGQGVANNSSEGWTGDGNQSGAGGGNPPGDRLGWFSDDSDTRSQTFDLTANADETVTISANLEVTGKVEPSGDGIGWEGDDTFTLTVTDSSANPIATQTYNPDGSAIENISFDITVPSDGIINVTFQSSNTENVEESWSIDNFEIASSETQVLTFDTEGRVDLEALLDQANDFDTDGDGNVDSGETPDIVGEIDLAVGNHDLSNITLEDVLDITDADNTLKIIGDAGDTIGLDSEWSYVGSNSEYHEYSATDTVGTATLLIDIEIPIDVD